MALADETKTDVETVGGGRVEDFVALLKPRVMSLVVFTAFVGIYLAPGGIHPFIGAMALLCITVGAGASGALNMWYDSDIDAIMSRTLNRPIPRGRVERSDALTFGLVLSVFSVAMLGLSTNWLAAGLLAFTIFFYAVIYTMWLKRSTPQNIVIGGAAGALPPIVGWASATGSLSWMPIVMFLIIFLWTPPHFWALALYKRGDYEAAGIPMMPNVRGDRSTQNQIFGYTLILAAIAFIPCFLGFGLIYGAAALITGAIFVVLAWRVWRAKDKVEMKRLARATFNYSLSYLFVLFLAMVVDHVARGFGVI